MDNSNAINLYSASGPLRDAAIRVREQANKRRYQRQSLESLLSITAVCGDLVAVVLGFSLAYWFRLVSGVIPAYQSDVAPHGQVGYWKLIVLGWVIVTLGMLRQNLYRFEYLHTPRKTVVKFFSTLGICLFLFLGFTLVVRTEPAISRLFVFCSAFFIVAIFYVWRLVLSSLIRMPAMEARLRRRMLLVGWCKQASHIHNIVSKGPDSIWEYTGWLKTRSVSGTEESQGALLGDSTELQAVLHKYAIDVVVLADHSMSGDEVAKVANVCEMEHVDFKMVPRSFEILISGLSTGSIGNVPVLAVENLPLHGHMNRFVKRFVDIVGACVGLLFSMPVMAFFGAIVFFQSPGPIFYRQIRTGRNGRSFGCIKIRSMRLDAEKGGAQWAQENDPRRLSIGSFMRKWNIDEVPQFWNVLKGEMSLVGPRPERPELIEKFKYTIPHYNARHSCRPGMTGWAQVRGWRGNTDLEERIRHDIWYVEHWNLWLDIKIMILTFCKQKNAY